MPGGCPLRRPPNRVVRRLCTTTGATTKGRLREPGGRPVLGRVLADAPVDGLAEQVGVTGVPGVLLEQVDEEPPQPGGAAGGGVVAGGGCGGGPRGRPRPGGGRPGGAGCGGPRPRRRRRTSRRP